MADPIGFEPDGGTPGDFEPLETSAPTSAVAPIQEPQPGLMAQATSPSGIVPFAEQAVAGAMESIGRAFAPLEKFKSRYITPLVKAGQAQVREAWLGTAEPDSPGLAAKQGKPYRWHPEAIDSPGERLRWNAPGKAAILERAGKLFLGETSFNTADPEAASPAITAQGGVIDEWKAKYGEVPTAAILALTDELGELPFYLIPGGRGSAAIQGLKSGLAQGMVDPRTGVAESTLLSGAVGGGLEVAVKGGKTIVKKLSKATPTSRPSLEPVALVTPEDEAALAEKVMNMAEPLPETALTPEGFEPLPGAKQPERTVASGPRRQPPVVVAVGVGPDGKPQAKALHVENGQVAAVPVKMKDVPKDTKPVLTNEAWAKIQEDPNSDFAYEAFPAPRPEMGPERILDLAEWHEVNPVTGIPVERQAPVREGSVLVLEGNGGDGSARLYEINSPKLQREVLRQRVLVELTQPDGSKVLGFYGDGFLIPPDADELLPRAAKEFLPVPDKAKLRIIDDTGELNDVLLERERAVQDLEDSRLVQEADAQAAMAPPPPPPPPQPPQGPPPPPGPHNSGPLLQVKLGWAQSLGNVLRRNFSTPTTHGDLDLADAATTRFSVDSFERFRKDTFDALRDATPELSKLPLPAQRIVRADITKFVIGDMDARQLRQAHPELNRAIFDRMELEKAALATDEARLQSLGMVPTDAEKAAMQGITVDDLEDYATRMHYRDQLAPGEWAKSLKRDTIKHETLVQAMQNEYYSGPKYATYTPDQRRALAEKHVDYLAGQPAPKEWFTKKAQAHYEEVTGSLKSRKDLKWFELAALGEIEDPFIRIAESRARQKQLILLGEVNQAVASNPEFAVRADAATPEMIRSGDWLPPEETNRISFGNARGMWIRRDVHDALVTIPLMQKNVSSFMRGLQQSVKWNQTVGNPGSWFNNVRANLQGVMLSNLVNPFTSPVTLGRGMLTATTDLKAHLLAPGIDTHRLHSSDPKIQATNVARQRFERMLKGGVVGSEYSTHEFRTSIDAWHRELTKQAGLGKGKVSALDVLNGFRNQKNRALDWFSNKYAGIDTMFKYSTAVAGLEKAGINLGTGGIGDMKKALKFLTGAQRYRAQMPEREMVEQIEAEVIRRIHFSFPMMDRVAPAVAALANTAAHGIGNRYAKVKGEQYRIYAQLPGRIASEAGMKANMLMYTAALGTFVAGPLALARAKAGVTQEEIDAAFASAPLAVQRFRPGATALWIRLDNGRLVFVDLTPMLEPLTWLVGDEDASPLVNALRNFAMSPLDGNLYEPGIAEMLSQGGLMDPAFSHPKVPEWAKGSAKVIGSVLNAMGPGVFRNTYNTLNRGQIGFAAPSGHFVQREPQSPVATGINLVLGPGFITEAGSAKDMEATIRDARRAYTEAVREYKTLSTKTEGQSVGPMSLPLDKEQAMKRAEQNIQEKLRKLNKLETLFKKTGRYQ